MCLFGLKIQNYFSNFKKIILKNNFEKTIR